MDATHVRLLDEVRGLVAARALINDALAQKIGECVAVELDRSTWPSCWESTARRSTGGTCGHHGLPLTATSEPAGYPAIGAGGCWGACTLACARRCTR